MKTSAVMFNLAALAALGAATLGFAQGTARTDGKLEVRRTNLSDIAGTWKKEAGVEKPLTAQDRVDDALWKS